MLAKLKRLRLSDDALIVVGFSGGPDSLALAAVLSRIARVAPARLLLLHVDHGLHEQSSEHAERCAELASSLGAPFETAKIAPDDLAAHPGAGIEETARRLRYVAFARAAERHGTSLVATAHHRDDQAETLLLHLLRGSGLHGATGMSEDSTITVPWWDAPALDLNAQLRLWRPFLTEPREELLGYVARTGLEPVIDPTNSSDRFRRNRLRNELMPMLESIVPGASASLARFAELVADEDAFLGELARDALGRVLRSNGSLDRDLLLNEPLVLQRRLVRQWIDADADNELSRNRVEAVLDAAKISRGCARIELAGNRIVVVNSNIISLSSQEKNQGET
jgi:tRNA(Ile)-lysidine synthase